MNNQVPAPESLAKRTGNDAPLGSKTKSFLWAHELGTTSLHSKKGREESPTMTSLSMGLQAPASTGLQVPAKSLLQHGRPGYLLQWGSPWAAGVQLPQHGLYHRMQGDLSSSTWRTSCPPSPLILVSTGLFLSRVITSLFSDHSYISAMISFFLKSVITRHYYHHRWAWLWSAVVHLEVSRDWLCWTQGKLLEVLTEATPVAPLLEESCHTNPMHLDSELLKFQKHHLSLQQRSGCLQLLPGRALELQHFF